MEIDYFFEFSSESEALADSAVSPSLANPQISRRNIWGFDLAPNLMPTIPPGQKTKYWCMVAQGSTNAAFLAHPNIKFFSVVPTTVLYQNMGNGVFLPISVRGFDALYAKDWALGIESMLVQAKFYVLANGGGTVFRRRSAAPRFVGSPLIYGGGP